SDRYNGLGLCVLLLPTSDQVNGRLGASGPDLYGLTAGRIKFSSRLRAVINVSVISVRARARRATRHRQMAHAPRDVSIRARARRATGWGMVHGSPLLFQSAPARGGRPAGAWSTDRHFCFNPRPREAGDRLGHGPRIATFVSIRARA